MNRTIWITGLLIAGIVLVATAARAQDVEIEIGLIEGDPFELVFVARLPAGVGDSCTGEADSRNNDSIRKGTDFVFISGGTVVAVIHDVEAEGFGGAGIGFTANGPVDVYVRLGVNGIFSAGVFLEVTCNPPTTTTTTTSESSTTTTTKATPSTSTTVPPATTTTEPAPIGGVPTGGGALEHFVSTDPTSSDGTILTNPSSVPVYGLFILMAAMVAGGYLLARATDMWKDRP